MEKKSVYLIHETPLINSELQISRHRGFVDRIRDVSRGWGGGEDRVSLSLYDVYSPRRKCQVKASVISMVFSCLPFPLLIEIFFFVCANRINILRQKLSSNRLLIAVKGFLNSPNIC